MKKSIVIILTCFVVLLFISCSTTFDTTLLRASDSKVARLLPPLEVVGANTIQGGSQNQVSTSTFLFTTFRREIERNVIESSGDIKGTIELDLIYSEFNAKPGWASGYELLMEFDIIISNNEGKKVWRETYSGSKKGSSSAVFWGLNYDEVIENETIALEHELLELFKEDVSRDYEKIVNLLN